LIYNILSAAGKIKGKDQKYFNFKFYFKLALEMLIKQKIKDFEIACN